MSKKVLIIDDSPTVLEMLKAMFVAEGFEAITADNGQNGLLAVTNSKPDVAIVDTLMPDIDGFEVCRKIKADKTCATKIIMMTGNIDAVDALKAHEAGADDYCAKTSDYTPLLEAVKKLI